MFSGWFSDTPKKEENPGGEQKEGSSSSPSSPPPPAQQQDSGVFGGAFSFMKGIFGVDQLKVEETTGDNKLDVDEGKRKGLFSMMSSYIGKDITSMISLPVWIFEPVSFLQIMAEPLQYESLLQKVNIPLILLILINYSVVYLLFNT